MKCITNGKEVLRVSDEVANHYISREGWEYCQKRKVVPGFICNQCGKKYSTKPDACSGCTYRKVMKNDVEVREKVPCKSKSFSSSNITVAAW